MNNNISETEIVQPKSAGNPDRARETEQTGSQIECPDRHALGKAASEKCKTRHAEPPVGIEKLGRGK
jgi:hypothetical protein